MRRWSRVYEVALSPVRLLNKTFAEVVLRRNKKVQIECVARKLCLYCNSFGLGVYREKVGGRNRPFSSRDDPVAARRMVGISVRHVKTCTASSDMRRAECSKVVHACYRCEREFCICTYVFLCMGVDNVQKCCSIAFELPSPDPEYV